MLQVGMRCFLPDRCLSAGRFLQVLPAEKREMLTGTPEGVSQDAAACAMYAQAQELLPEVLVTAQIINHSKTANLFFFFTSLTHALGHSMWLPPFKQPVTNVVSLSALVPTISAQVAISKNPSLCPVQVLLSSWPAHAKGSSAPKSGETATRQTVHKNCTLLR